MKALLLSHQKNTRVSGFTLVELLIAMTVFSVVLILVILGIRGFFITFYRSQVNASTQNTVRTISNTIEKSLEYSATTPEEFAPTSTQPVGLLCTGNQEFAYLLGKAVGTPEAPTFGLHELSVTPGDCPTDPQSQGGWNTGTSLLGNNYRLITFKLTPLSSPANYYALDIKIAYTSGGAQNAGDDLLCSPSVIPATDPGGCAPSTANLTDFTLPDITCKTSAGSQFCDVAELQSIVENRLN